MRGKIVAKLGEGDVARAELQRALTLAEQLQSPALIYPLASDFAQWYETAGQEREAAVLYGKAKAAIEHMATVVEDDALCSIFRQSAPIQAVYEHAARLGM